MIEMRNFKVRVPSERDALVGYEGENEARQIVIHVDEIDGWQYKLDLERVSTQEKFTFDMLADGNDIIATLDRAHVAVPGTLDAQVRALNGEVEKKSNIFHLRVGDSVNATGELPPLPPNEFEQMEQNLTAIKQQAVQAAGRAEDAADEAETFSKNAPKIVDGTWWTWDFALGTYVDTGLQAKGDKGDKGEKGERGEKGDQGVPGQPGEDGFSPNASVTQTETGAVVTVIDKNGTTTATLTNGKDGATGEPGASVKSIRRTSGTGAAGTMDTYTMYNSNDAVIGTFTIYNGSNGEGSGDFMANGMVPMTGNLTMGGNRVTGLGAPQDDTDAVRKQDLGVLSDALDAVTAGETPIVLPNATETKTGAVKPGNGIEVTKDGTLNVITTAQDIGAIPNPEDGTAGQVLTKTADGQAWQDAPDGLPEGGAEGQVLTRTRDGAAWGYPGGVTSFNGRAGEIVPQAGDYTSEMVGAIDQTEKGRASGVASLDAQGKVPAGQLPPMAYDPAGSAASALSDAKAYTDSAIGNINTLLDQINGEVI